MTLKHAPACNSQEIGTLLKLIRAIPLSGSSDQSPLSKLYLGFSINYAINRYLTGALCDAGVINLVGSFSRYTYERLISDVTLEVCTRVLTNLRLQTRKRLIASMFSAEITPDVLYAEANVIFSMLVDMLKDCSPSGKWLISMSFSKRCASYGINHIATSYLPSYLLREGAMVKYGRFSVPVKDVSITTVFKALSSFHSEVVFSKMTVLTVQKLNSMLGDDKVSAVSSNAGVDEVNAEEATPLPVVPADCDTGSYEEYDLPESEANKAKSAWEAAILKAQAEQKKADAERERKERILRDRQQEEDFVKREEVILDKLRRPDKYAKLSSYLSKVGRLPRPCLAPGSEAWWFSDGLTLRYGIIQSASLEEKKSESDSVVLSPHYVVVTCAAPFESVTVDCDVYSTREEMLDAMDATLSALR